MRGTRLFRVLHREVRGLHEAAYVLALFTLGSQVFALLRDRIFAHSFGAGETLDVFYAAFRIPDTLYALLASMVSLFVLIPFMERAGREGKDSVRRFLSSMFTFFSGALILVALVAWVCAPKLVSVLYGGFTLEMQEMLIPVVRVLLLQPLFLGVSNLFAAFVQIRGRFLLYATAPILYNIGIIVGAVALYPVMGIMGLAWGVVLGAVLHLGIQVPFVVREGVMPRVVLPDWRQVREVVLLSIPRTITLSAQQLVLLVLVSLASLFAVGSVSSFTFAWNLAAVPLALIGVSYSVAAFPKLAHLYSNGKRKEYDALMLTAARQIIFWALPVTVLFVVIRAQVVRVLLGSGAFDWDDTMMTAAILALLVVSLVAQGLVVLLVRACYAAGKTAVPLVLSLIGATVTILAAFLLLHGVQVGWVNLDAFAVLMRVEQVAGTEVLLIAGAYSLGSFVTMTLLLGYFARHTKSFAHKLARTTLLSLVASIGAGIVAYSALDVLDEVVSLEKTIGVFLQGLGAGAMGILMWIATLTALGSSELADAWQALHKRLTRKRVQSTQGSIGEG